MNKLFEKTALQYASAIIRTNDLVEVFGWSVVSDATKEDMDALADLKLRIAKTVGAMGPIE